LVRQSLFFYRDCLTNEATPDHVVWPVVPHREADQHEGTVLASTNATFIVAPTILDAHRLSYERVIPTSKKQGDVERGCCVLSDPFFLASFVCVKKPERVCALRFIVVFCVVGVPPGRVSAEPPIGGKGTHSCEPGEHATHSPHHTRDVPCVEGSALVHIRMDSRWHTRVLGLRARHQQVLRLRGSVYSLCTHKLNGCKGARV
jgi:hypothetical protein